MAKTKSPTKKKNQTTTIKGARVIITTSASGKVTIKPAPVLEWELQAAAVRALKAMPEYAASADDATTGSFTIAADMNGDYRGKRAAVIAKATGIAAGDPDVRIYAAGGRLLLIEYKNAVGKLSADQVKRHALLAALGYTIETIKAASGDEAAAASVAVVRSWLDGDAQPASKAAS